MGVNPLVPFDVEHGGPILRLVQFSSRNHVVQKNVDAGKFGEFLMAFSVRGPLKSAFIIFSSREPHFTDAAGWGVIFGVLGLLIGVVAFFK